MKSLKMIAGALCVALIASSCNMSNTAKGSMIGAAGGGAAGAGLGAAIGALVNGGEGAKLGAAIGAGVGLAGGTVAGALIGRKMDKAAAAAAAVENAEAEKAKDANGLDCVKVTFDNGILFGTGKTTLQAGAQNSLKQFAQNVLNVYTDCDVAVQGFASSDGSDATNLTLSQSRADAVKNYLIGSCGVNTNQIKSSVGFGEDPSHLIMKADGTEDREASRRVEVYLYASEQMIKAANEGTLK
ncbi:MAG: OmpA family protein [Bacteroidaceae bacterium]|nr:OmpA family protein [Bacteroidaceae bacterium]